jgi:hypothetical protein
MIEKILKNIAYIYYPLRLCSLKEYDQYTQSDEFKILSGTINRQLLDKDYQNLRKQLLNEFKKNESIQSISDVTLEGHDRCLTFQIEIIESNSLIKICLNVSLLIPYYFIYVLKNDIELEPTYRWLNHPKRNRESEVKFDEELKLLEDIIKEKINFNKFPEYLIQMTIPEITYVDIELGKFTYFNAFFLDNINL